MGRAKTYEDEDERLEAARIRKRAWYHRNAPAQREKMRQYHQKKIALQPEETPKLSVPSSRLSSPCVYEDQMRPHIRSIRLKQGELIASFGVSLVAYAKVLLTRYKTLGHEDGWTSLVDLRANLTADLAVIEDHLLVIEQMGGIRHVFWKEGAATRNSYVHLVDGVTDMLEWAAQRKLKNAGKAGVLLFQQRS